VSTVESQCLQGNITTEQEQLDVEYSVVPLVSSSSVVNSLVVRSTTVSSVSTVWDCDSTRT